MFEWCVGWAFIACGLLCGLVLVVLVRIYLVFCAFDSFRLGFCGFLWWLLLCGFGRFVDCL